MNELLPLLLLLFPLLSFFCVGASSRKFVLAIGSSSFLYLLHPCILILALFTSIFNFIFSHILHLNRSKYLLLFFIFLHVCNIIFFKYLFKDFFFQINNHTAIQQEFGRLITIIGLSYYSLQAISYLIDVYFKKISVENDFLDLYNYLAFFPKIIQGPIENPKAFLNQLKQKVNIKQDTLVYAVFLICLGVLKKEFIADTLEVLTFEPINNFERFTGITIFFTVVVKGIVLYFNFFGIMDIARGVAIFFGIQLSRNFFQPFFSSSLLEFWRNWHRTFFQWISEYVFLPLAQSLRSIFILKTALAISILICFLLSALWHSWHFNFLLFGLFHGIACLIDIGTKKYRDKIRYKLNINKEGIFFRTLSICFVFFIWNIGLVLTSFLSLNETKLFISHILSNMSLGYFFDEMRQVLIGAKLHGATSIHFYTSGLLFVLFMIFEAFEKFHPQKISSTKLLSINKFFVFIFVFLVTQLIIFSPAGVGGYYMYSIF